jgi:predicted Zn-dependent protease
MPGGKVMFYTGILPICDGEDGIATVMGHEIAHAIARHGNERMSQQLSVQAGGMALSVLLKEKPETAQNLFLASYGIGSQLGVLKYSRMHESEADKMGLVFMVMAGYDPAVAADFWKRMAANKNGQAPPEFMSTHPSDERRIQDIKDYLPEARKYAK